MSVLDTTMPPCIFAPEFYDDDDLLDPPTREDVSAAQWKLVTAKRDAAHRQCAGCPMMVDCLYRAVVEVDVSGFVACTTESDRRWIRRQLGVRVTTTTPYGAPRVGGGPVDHEAVLAARLSHPKDSCQQLAERLDCSTSTIKRHLKLAREHKLTAVRSAPAQGPVLPTVDAVLDCFDLLESSQVA